ncbi:MAG: molybdopterin-binding protein, partial [Defluviitaleaceae bacterium]|nr:molybdopterin-binding protein [Defluviitaleaceae bacterium]
MLKRNLYLTNIPIDEALANFRARLGDAPISTEVVETRRALGKMTAQAVFARNSSPMYDCAAMDGIAVESRKTHGAGGTSPMTLQSVEDYVAVDTGDPVKPPFDAVIMAEDVVENPDGTVTIRQSVAPWKNVRPVGEDIVQGDMILPSRHKIRPVDIGVMISGGISKVVVEKPVSVAIIPTGSELVEVDAPMRDGSIIESNSYMLEALTTENGAIPARMPIVPDAYDTIKSKLLEAVENHDIVLVCSGTSAGREDYAIHALKDIGEVVAHGVAQKPGKPVILAVVKGKPVIGVPGYPVAAYLTFENFVKPLLTERIYENVVKVTLTRNLVSSFKSRDYVRVKVGLIGEKLVATPLARGGGAAMTLVRADGFCIIDQSVEGLDAGFEADVILSRKLKDIEGQVVSVGSYDALLDIAADLMRIEHENAGLAVVLASGVAGLMALKNGEAHIAPIHLEDEDVIKKMFEGKEMALIKGVKRARGIMVKKGNPLNIQSTSDLTKSGTRFFEREAVSSLAVAAAVAGENMDAGMGTMTAANALGLDFIPVSTEEFDFATFREFLGLE